MNNKKLIFLILIPLILCSVTCQIPKNTMPDHRENRGDSQFSTREKTELLIKKHIGKNKIVGWVVGLRRQGQKDLFIHGGYADWSRSIPMTSDKVFKIGSITKLITSILILQLVEQKKISLNDSIRKFLPELPTVFNDVKITRLLNHTAGLKEYVDEKTQSFMYGDKDHSSIIDIISKGAIDSSGKFNYSNSHYFLLGKLIESISGMKFREYVTQQLSNPLNLHSLRGNCNEDGKTVPLGYKRHPESFLKKPKLPDRPLSLHNAGAAGSLCGNASDLLSIIKAFFNFKIVNKNLVQLAQKTLPKGKTPHSQYGFGLWKTDWGKITGFGHGGGTGRFTSAAFHIAEKKMEIVVLVNTNWAPDILDLVRDIAEKIPD